MREFKVICVDVPIRIGGLTFSPSNTLKPILISVPDSLLPEKLDLKTLANLLSSESGVKDWSAGKIYLTEKDAKENFLIKAMFESAEWQSIKPLTLQTPTNANEALEYFRATKQPIPEYEGIIAQSARESLLYSCENSTPFPAGEVAISENPDFSVRYAEAHGIRFKSAEGKIAEDDTKAEEYGKLMLTFDLWRSWTHDEIARSPVWIYQYAKDYLCGRLPENLHSAMTMFSFSKAGNKWVKKYFKTKKYRPKAKA